MGGVGSKSETKKLWEHKVENKTLTKKKDYGYIEFEIEPFCNGEFRYAFAGTIKGPIPDGFRTRHVVVKIFIRHTAALEDVNLDIAALQVAGKFATLFNAANYVNRTVKFCEAMVSQIDKKGYTGWFLLFGAARSKKYVVDEYVTVEQHLGEGYTKWNNNWGYFDSDSITMPGFSHFTFHQSGCNMLVCDLQGCKEGDEYRLTDPAVHSLEKKFGKTDMGPLGMLMFFATHKCNFICKQFKKPKLSPHIKELARKIGLTCGTTSGSVYDFTATKLVENAKVQEFAAAVLDGMDVNQQMEAISTIMKNL
eukprot:g441.t1